MSFNLVSSLAILIAAGNNVNANASTSGAFMAKIADMAEARIIAETRKDWVTDYSSVSNVTQEILEETAAAIAGMKLINWDMSGFTSREEAQTMLDVLRDTITLNMATLKDLKVQDFML